MEVADIELCKELYELSGWGNTEKRWHGSMQFPEKAVAILLDNADGSGLFPAYDLGYLLRKLPPYLQIQSNLTYWEMRIQDIEVQSTWPEDTACKLAIELFKQGILKREEV